MIAHSETNPRESIKDEKKVITCIMAEVKNNQFKSDPKEMARFLNDEYFGIKISGK